MTTLRNTIGRLVVIAAALGAGGCDSSPDTKTVPGINPPPDYEYQLPNFEQQASG